MFPDYEVVNVGSGVGVSLAELLSAVEDVVGFQANVTRLPSRPFDVERNVLDVERLTMLTGLSPLDLRAGMELTVAGELTASALL